MSRRRRPPSRGRGSADLTTSWPLDLAAPTPAPDPTPEPAATIESGTGRPSSALPPRAEDAHYCRHCDATGDGPVPPSGWLRLQRRGTGQRDSWRPWQTTGIFCSVGCLIAEATAWQTSGKAT